MTRPGFTLLEVVVVLVLLGLATALVVPALAPPSEGRASLQAVIGHVQRAALRRGEVLVLDVSTEGSWVARGTAAPGDVVSSGALTEGSLRGPVHLRVAPTGSCGWRLNAEPGEWRPPLDPLTCSLLPS